MTLLPETQVAFVRNVAKCAGVLFAWMMIERMHPGQPVSEGQFSAIMAVDVRTVRRHIKALSAASICTSQGGGWWMLTPQGRNTLFASVPQDHSQPVLYAQTGDDRDANFVTGNPQVSYSGDKKCLISAQNADLQHFVLSEEEESINLISTPESSSEAGTNCTPRQILQATEMLFKRGAVNWNPAFEARNPLFVLAWVAKAYADRANLQNPAGLVYQRLMKNELPPKKYREAPTFGLPDVFLLEIGMGVLMPSEDEDLSGAEDSDSVQPLAQEPVGEAAALWGQIKDILRIEMPKAGFDTFVAPSEGVALDDHRLTVRSANKDSAEWLDNRLSAVVRRLIPGISGCPADLSVVFVGGS